MKRFREDFFAGRVAVLTAFVVVLLSCTRRADETSLLRAALLTSELPIRFSGSMPDDLERSVSPRALRAALRNAEAASRSMDYQDRSRAALAAAAAGRALHGAALLENLLKDHPGDPALLSDLAGLHLAAATNDPWQIVLALEEANRALEVAPGHSAARHNRALALEHAGLVHRAREAWRSLEMEPADPWSIFAARQRSRLDEIIAAAPAVEPPPRLENAEAWRTAARRDPGQAIEDAVEHLAPSLRSCLMKGNRGSTSFKVWSALVEALRSKTPDLLLHDMAGNQAERRRAWRLWQLHREIVRTYEEDEFQKMRAALAILRREDLSRDPWLRGEMEGFTALLVGLDGRLGEALASYEAAAKAYQEAVARHRTTWAQRLATQTLGELGLAELAWQRVQLDLTNTASLRSQWRHMHLGKTAQFLAPRAPRAAGEFWGEALEHGDADPAAPVVTLLLRAQNALDQGHFESARGDLTRAKKLLGNVRIGEYRAILERWLQLEALRVNGLNDPGSTVRELRLLAEKPAIADFSGVRIQGELAYQLERAGHYAEARDAYLAALGRLAEENAGTRAAFRATPAEERALLDRTIAFLALTLDEPEQALLLLERHRLHRRQTRDTRIADLVKRWPRTTAALAFWSLPDHTLVWVLRKGEPPREKVLDLPRKALERVAEKLGQLGPREGLSRETSQWLFSSLISPVAEELAGVSEVVLVRDGPLVWIPFAALRDPASGRFWVESAQLRYAPSLSALRDTAAGTTAPLTLLGVADPAAGTDWSALPGARDEVARAQSLYPRGDSLDGAEATETAVSAALSRGTTVLHVAAHAAVFPRAPSESWIALAPGERGDGRWTVGEISALRVPGAHLAVLASCRSGLDPGRGLVDGSAFAEALFAAGFSAVLVAKAQVGDRASVELLADFHAAYRQTRDPAEALRRAQLVAIARGEDPETWGIFEIVSVEL